MRNEGRTVRLVAFRKSERSLVGLDSLNFRTERKCRVTRRHCPDQRRWFRVVVLAGAFLIVAFLVPSARALMAGDETAFPTDSPAARLDTLESSSLFNAVGS